MIAASTSATTTTTTATTTATATTTSTTTRCGGGSELPGGVLQQEACVQQRVLAPLLQDGRQVLHSDEHGHERYAAFICLRLCAATVCELVH